MSDEGSYTLEIIVEDDDSGNTGEELSVSQVFKIEITPEVTVDCFLGNYVATEVALGATFSNDVTEAS